MGGLVAGLSLGFASELPAATHSCLLPHTGAYFHLHTQFETQNTEISTFTIYNSLASLCLFLLRGDNSLVGALSYVYMLFAFCLANIPMFMVYL